MLFYHYVLLISSKKHILPSVAHLIWRRYSRINFFHALARIEANRNLINNRVPSLSISLCGFATNICLSIYQIYPPTTYLYFQQALPSILGRYRGVLAKENDKNCNSGNTSITQVNSYLQKKSAASFASGSEAATLILPILMIRSRPAP